MRKTRASLAVSLLLLLLFALMFIDSLSFPKLAKYFPATISAIGILFSAWTAADETAALRRTSKADGEEDDRTEFHAALRGAVVNFAWVIGYLLTAALLGYILASVIYLAVYLKLKTDFRWYVILVSVVVTGAVLYLLQATYVVRMPRAAIEFLNYF